MQNQGLTGLSFLVVEDEPLLRAYGDTLRKRTDLLHEFERDDRST